MIITLTLHLLRRLWPLLVFPVLLLGVVASLFVLMIEPLGGVAFLSRMVERIPMLSRMADVAGMDFSSRASIASMAYVHPFTAAMMGLWPLSVGVASLAGDVESGFADQILSRAVPRRSVFLASVGALIVGSFVIGGTMWLGTAIGSVTAGIPEPLPLRLFGLAAVDVSLTMIAMGSVAILVSALSSDRGRVIAVSVALWLVNYFLGKIAPIFEFLEWLAPWSIEGHFRPVNTVSNGHLSGHDVAVHLSVTVVCLLMAAWFWHRRDIQD